MAEESRISEQKRLTENRDWDRTRASTGTGLRSRLVRLWFEETGGSYLGDLVCRVHCEKHLPSGALRVLEIGRAPGHELPAVNRLFGYQPYGVDYNASGVALDRELFVQAGLDPEQVMHEECFEAGFQARFRSYFDVVMSHGFVEHFANPAQVLEAHASLLNPGGLLLVTVRGGLCYRGEPDIFNLERRDQASALRQRSRSLGLVRGRLRVLPS